MTHLQYYAVHSGMWFVLVNCPEVSLVAVEGALYRGGGSDYQVKLVSLNTINRKHPSSWIILDAFRLLCHIMCECKTDPCSANGYK